MLSLCLPHSHRSLSHWLSRKRQWLSQPQPLSLLHIAPPPLEMCLSQSVFPQNQLPPLPQLNPFQTLQPMLLAHWLIYHWHLSHTATLVIVSKQHLPHPCTTVPNWHSPLSPLPAPLQAQPTPPPPFPASPYASELSVTSPLLLTECKAHRIHHTPTVGIIAV